MRALFFKISPKISLNEVKNGQWKFWYHLEKLYSGTMKYFGMVPSTITSGTGTQGPSVSPSIIVVNTLLLLTTWAILPI